MSILNDKTFEGMDWISQAVEPYHCEINDILAQLPDEHILTASEAIKSIVRRYDRSIDKSFIISELCKNINTQYLNYDERSHLDRCFSLTVDGPIVINADEAIMAGTVKLIKKTNIVEDKVVRDLIRRSGRIEIARKDIVKEAMNDLGNLMLIDAEIVTKFNSQSPKGKFSTISNYLYDAVDKDEFKFRSVKACRAFMKIVAEYLSTNDPKKLGAIYRVVMMSRRGQVIYSVEA